MSQLQFLSNRISYKEQEHATTIAISGKISTTHFVLLSGWLIAFSFCGFYFLYELFWVKNPEIRIPLIILISFWAYFEYKITYVWFWRKYGIELIKFGEGKVIVKRSIKSYGKAIECFIPQVKRFEKRVLKNNFFAHLENSFWTIGAETIMYNVNNREIRLGIQLTEEESDKLYTYLNHTLKKFKHVESTKYK